MKIEDIQEQLNNLGGSEESKKAIGKLIDMKTDENMDKLLGAIDKLDHKLDVSVGSLRSEMNASIGSLNTKLETSIGSLNTKLETSIGSLRSEMGYIKWFIAVGIALAAAFRFFN